MGNQLTVNGFAMEKNNILPTNGNGSHITANALSALLMAFILHLVIFMDDLRLLCSPHPPFLELPQYNKSDHPHGTFWKFTLQALQHCTDAARPPNSPPSSSSSINNCTHMYNNEFDALRSFSTSNAPTIILPITNHKNLELPDTEFISLIRSPGAVIVTNPLTEGGLTQNLGIILQGWPLLLIILLSCCLASLIIWILERLGNPQEFPRPFWRGFWDGCWWAFISMTTVGYGDKVPQSVAGRIFTFCWIIAGIVVTSMFTAAITTALNQVDSPSHQASYNFQKAAVITGTYEKILLHMNGYTPQDLNDVDELIDFALNQSRSHQPPEEGQPHGFVVEHFMFLHLRSEYESDFSKLKADTILRETHERGILLSRVPPPIGKCMRQYIASLQANIIDHTVGIKHHVAQEVKTNSEEKMAKKLFGITNYIPLLIFASIIFGTILFAFLWDIVYWRPRNTDYFGIEQNWKRERAKQQLEFKKRLDFKRYYKSKKENHKQGSIDLEDDAAVKPPPSPPPPLPPGSNEHSA